MQDNKNITANTRHAAGALRREQHGMGGVQKCFGVFGYQKEPLREIAMYHMAKEDAVEKAKRRAQTKLGEQMVAPRETDGEK